MDVLWCQALAAAQAEAEAAGREHAGEAETAMGKHRAELERLKKGHEEAIARGAEEVQRGTHRDRMHTGVVEQVCLVPQARAAAEVASRQIQELQVGGAREGGRLKTLKGESEAVAGGRMRGQQQPRPAHRRARQQGGSWQQPRGVWQQRRKR